MHPGLARSIPFALFMGFIAARPAFEPLLGALHPWSYALQTAVVLVAIWIMRRHYPELSDRGALGAGNLALAVGVGVLVFLLWIQLDLPWLSLGQQASFEPPRRNGELDALWLAMRVFGASIVVPVMEELFWRSFLMRWLETPSFAGLAPARVGLRAVVISSLLFGVEHQMWFAGLIAGLAYAYLYRRGNLWLAIIAHGVTNLSLGLFVIASGQWKFW